MFFERTAHDQPPLAGVIVYVQWQEQRLRRGVGMMRYFVLQSHSLWLFGCSQQFSVVIVDYCTIRWCSTVWYESVFTPSRSSATSACSWSEQTRTEGSGRSWGSPRRLESLGVRSGGSPEQQWVWAPRDTEWGPWQSSAWSLGCEQPPGPPPAASSICSSGSETRSSPESPSGGETPPAPLSPSCSGTASCRRWTPAGRPGCGWTRSGSSSSEWSSRRTPAPAGHRRRDGARRRPSGCCPLSSARSRRCPRWWTRTRQVNLGHWSSWSSSDPLDLYCPLMDLKIEL